MHPDFVLFFKGLIGCDLVMMTMMMIMMMMMINAQYIRSMLKISCRTVLLKYLSASSQLLSQGVAKNRSRSSWKRSGCNDASECSGGGGDGHFDEVGVRTCRCVRKVREAGCRVSQKVRTARNMFFHSRLLSHHKPRTWGLFAGCEP